MDGVLLVVGAVAGAVTGAAYGVGAARLIAARGSAWFWVAAAFALVAGIAAAALGALSGTRAAAWGGFAFAAAAITALKWRSGKVPGIPVRRPGAD